MRIRRSTILGISAEQAWAAVLQPRLLDHIAWPLQVFERVDPLKWPSTWREGAYEVRLRLFGVVPMGSQRVFIRDVLASPDRNSVRDAGGGDIARRWDHLITIKPVSPTRCRYTDEVEVRAGALTPFVTAFAWLFYAHRQRCWRRLVARGSAPLAQGEPA